MITAHINLVDPFLNMSQTITVMIILIQEKIKVSGLGRIRAGPAGPWCCDIPTRYGGEAVHSDVPEKRISAME